MSEAKAEAELNTWHRIEGLLVFAVATFSFYAAGGSPVMYLVLILSFDVFMIGYLRDKRMGALIYNLGHNYGTAAIFLLGAWAVDVDILIKIGILWMAHVGMDRAFGYGLKKSTGFKHTHLGHIGKK